MKKSVFNFGAILGVVLAVAGCNKEIDNSNVVEGGFPFEVSASTLETKTVNDGLSTKWAANDGINLFNAVAGSSTYKNNNQFTISKADLNQNRFKGELAAPLEPGTSYDWYAFYPYNSHVQTPANTNRGFVTLGHEHDMSEIQNGNDSKAHLIGDACPLYGKALSVSSEETPSLAMHHLASVVEVKVTNKNDAPLTVSKVTMTGTEDIVGTYYINFVDEPVVYTNSGLSYVSDKVILDVQNGTAIAKGETATFYLSFKPFTAKSGSVLKLAVNGYEKTLELTKDVTFSAGKIKTLNFNFDQPVGSEVVQYTLVPIKGSNNSYTGNCDIDINGITWNLNGNSQIHPWRIGGKSITDTDRTLYSKTPFAQPLTKVTLEVGTISITVNSVKLLYSTNADFTDAKEVLPEGAIEQNSIWNFVADYPANCYYKFVFNVTNSTSSNKFIQVKKVEFWGN